MGVIANLDCRIINRSMCHHLSVDRLTDPDCDDDYDDWEDEVYDD